MSDKRTSHVPPPRYKSTARPWHDIPGRCGYFMGEPPKRTPCALTATHRCKKQDKRYGWLCKKHAGVVTYATPMLPVDADLLRDGRACDVWKCTRSAVKWTEDGYAICNNCSGN